MSETRILMPREELSNDMRSRYFSLYDDAQFMVHCTRPLHSPDEWTEDERKEFENVLYKKDGYNVWQVGDPEDAARKAIDIATRPAPVEHKPCPFCGVEVESTSDGDIHHPVVSDCNMSNMYYEGHAWDRRA